ncbi:hypothetical protein DFQ11_1345 [Winogradskyella epiphytica]|uniref:Uncharacterized protein n=2 Tax=Winogradskyella epiphytica TaxID=262005 RepID=A0A2V4XB87_9FLAO|nr:hypothetical protein [Winogradskyella epiphytica]PYE78475.1 hypothetical protein DFQ11_1345 [Winogradskyella epiphytica]
MMKPYREIEKMTEPIRKMQKQLSASTLAMQKAVEPALAMQKSLEQPLLNFQKSFEHINKIYASIPKFENPILEHLDTFKEIGERLKEYAERTPEYFLLIAQHGWFIDLECELNLPLRVAYELQDGKLETANELLIEYYKENLEQIFQSLIKRHPNRKEILNQILDAYKNGSHSLLIPSVLTQVDGICFDFTKRKFFIKERKNKYLPQVTSELEKSAGNFLDLYLSPLQNQTPIMVQEKDISKFPCHLNRHEILHGINADYGTEINSLKVISLLKYISDLLTDLDRKTLSTTPYKING